MAKKIIAVDCETDPFLHGRVPMPFIWGAFDGKNYEIFRETTEFVEWLRNKDCYAYAHNGGKFDFIYLLDYIKETRAKIISGRIAEMRLGKARLRDSYSIIPVPLGAIHKDKIDYGLMEAHCREQNMPEIISYLKTDVRVLWETVTTYRKVAGGALTIASNAMASSKKLGCNPGKTNARYDREFREYYFGGRTECFKPGTHQNLTIVDIVSSYPKAMMQEHATGDDRTEKDGPDAIKGLSKEELNRSFIRLRCNSRGAFPIRKDDGGLDFPHGVREFYVTGWEYNAALEFNIISDVEILSAVTFKAAINFKPYIEKWFEHKKSHPKKDDPINYTIGKIMMNSE